MKTGDKARFVLRNEDSVCFIGDSVTAGGFYIKYVSAACSGLYPGLKLHFLNCGNPGDTTVNALARLEREVLAMKPSWAVIALGINDVRDITLYQYHRNMQEIIRHSKAAGARIMLLTPTSYDDDPAKQPAERSGYVAEMLNNEAVVYHNRALVRMREDMLALAKEHDCLVADVYTPFRQLIEQRQQGKHVLDLLPDRLHPSEDGHVVIAIAVLKGFGISNTEIGRSGLAIPPAVRAVFGLHMKPVGKVK